MKIKRLLVLVLAILSVFALVACKDEEGDKTYVTPTVTGGDALVYNANDIKVSKELTYKMIKNFGGIDLLEDYIDSIILKDQIASIKANPTTHQQELINKFKADAKEAAGGEQELLDALVLQGYEGDDYFYFLTAREEKAVEYAKNEVNDYYSEYYVSEEDIEAYYEANKYTIFGESAEASAIVINFFSLADYINALHEMGAVIYNSDIKLIVGEDAKTFPERQYSETNTKSLSEYEGGASKFFCDLYNHVYEGYRTKITTAGIQYNYTTLSENAEEIAETIFSLNEGEYTYMATSKSTTISDYYTVVYKTVADASKTWSDLTQEEKDKVREAYIEALIDNNLDYVLSDIREEANLEFVDRDFQYLYDSEADVTEFEGSSTVIFKLNGTEYTADQFYQYVETRNIELYILYASIYSIAAKTNTYKLVYGENQDLYANASLKKVNYQNTALSYVDTTTSAEEQGFTLLKNGYSYSNLADAVVLDSMRADMLYSIVLDELFKETTLTIEGTKVDEDTQETVPDNKEFENVELTKQAYKDYANSVIAELSSNYYYLTAHKVVITADTDGDYKADDLSQVASYQTALTALYAKIASIADTSTTQGDSTDGKTEFVAKIQEFIEKYNDATVQDAEFGEFKKMGLVIKYSQIGTSTIRSVNDTNTYTQAIKDEIVKLYKGSSESSLYNWSTGLVHDEDGETFLYTIFNGKNSASASSSSYKPTFKYETKSVYYNPTDTNESDDVAVTMTLQQLTYFSYVKMFDTMLSSATTAADTYNVTEYPTAIPSTFSSTHYTPYTSKMISKYFTNKTFAYSLVANMLAEGQEAGNAYAKLAEVYARALAE